MHRILGAQLIGTLRTKPTVLQHGAARVGDGIERRVLHDAAATWANNLLGGFLVSKRHGGLLSLQDERCRAASGKTESCTFLMVQRTVQLKLEELPYVPNCQFR